MVNNNINSRDQFFYVYFINAALVFAELYGFYLLNPEKMVTFQSKALICGETATFYIPTYAYDVHILVDVSYIFWANVYRAVVSRNTENFCLLTTGFLFATICTRIPCSSSIPPATPPTTPLTYGNNNSNILNNSCNIQNNNCGTNTCLNNSNSIYTCNSNKNIVDASNNIIYSSASNSAYASKLHNNCATNGCNSCPNVNSSIAYNKSTACYNPVDSSSSIIYNSAMNRCK